MTPRFHRARLPTERIGFARIALVQIAFAAASSPVLGAPATTSPAPSPQGDEGAQQSFRAGVEAARQERWNEARAAFEHAYVLSPRPVVLINLAGAQARTGRLIEAAKNYRRILDVEASADTGGFRRAASDVLPALDARIPRVRLQPSGLVPTDVIRLDGDVVAVSALMDGKALDPGEHTLVVERAGTERARVLFALTERELRYIRLPLPTAAPPSDGQMIGLGLPGEGTPVGANGRQSSSQSPSWLRSPWTWATIAAVVAAGSITAFVIADHHDQLYSGNLSPGQVTVR